MEIRSTNIPVHQKRARMSFASWVLGLIRAPSLPRACRPPRSPKAVGSAGRTVMSCGCRAGLLKLNQSKTSERHRAGVESSAGWPADALPPFLPPSAVWHEMKGKDVEKIRGVEVLHLPQTCSCAHLLQIFSFQCKQWIAGWNELHTARLYEDRVIFEQQITNCVNVLPTYGFGYN